MKKTEKIISLIENGYGLIQTMKHPEVNINKEELLSLMAENAELNKKMRKRFGDEIFENEPEEPDNQEPENGENENSDPEQHEPENGEPENAEQEEPTQEPENRPTEMEELRAEADALGIKYNPKIGADKLRARIEEFKANK